MITFTSWKTTTAGILAIVGAVYGLYTSIQAHDLSAEKLTAYVSAILGGIGLMFARDNNVTSEDVQAAKDAKAARKEGGGFNLFLFLVIVAVALTWFTACKTPQLEAGGAYAPTNEVGQVVVNDVGLAVADAAYKFTYESALSVFEFERNNRAAIWKLSPDVKLELDKLRTQVVAIDHRWALARQAYRANPTPTGLSVLQTVLAELQRLLPVVQSQLGSATAEISNPARTE